jgi:hypothetical protein
MLQGVQPPPRSSSVRLVKISSVQERSVTPRPPESAPTTVQAAALRSVLQRRREKQRLGLAVKPSESLGVFPWTIMGLQKAACPRPANRSTSSAAKRRTVVERSALRCYRCARCGQVALVCSGCDHNQIYCHRGCADQARLESRRRAGARHQRTGAGRLNHAHRQASYRRRQKQKVTHHTPLPSVHSVQPCRSGPASLLDVPDKETPDVCSHPVPILPVSSLPALQANAAAPLPGSASPKVADAQPSPEHLCDFCHLTRSRYLRRDLLVELSRGKRGRRSRGPP